MNMPMTIHRRALFSGHPRIARSAARHAEFSAPWAIAGMITAFAGGTLLGMLGSKKGMMMHQGEQGHGWRMMKHHHHGFGESACRMEHGGSEMAAPGAKNDQSERNEGE